MRLFRLTALAVLSWLSLAAPALAAPAKGTLVDPRVITADPAVRQGVLPNGMRYAVMRNSLPARSVSFRLYMNIGSYDEADDERGVAHFLEHMAFNGTRHLAEGKLDTVFGQNGVAFGRDQNAWTSYFSTLYMLDVPQVDEGRLDLAFQWLRDIGDGMTLDPAAVMRERGVIRAEDDRTRGPERSWSETTQKFLGPELRSTARDAIGTTASIDAMTSERVRRFYEKWYRPENATLVVVGDVPAETLEKRVIAGFASWKGSGPAPAHRRPSSPNLSRGADFLPIAQPRMGSSVNLCWIRGYDTGGSDSLERTRLTLVRRLWRDVLNERLRALASSDDPPFVAAEAGSKDSEREALYSCVDASPVGDDWKRALDTVVGEVRRLELHGASSAEVGRALETVRAEHRSRADSMSARTSSTLAQRLSDLMAHGDVLASPKERFRILDKAAEGLNEAEVQSAFRRDIAGAGPFLIVTTPRAVSAAEVRQSYRAAMSAPAPAAAVATAKSQWAYTDFGPAGKVIKRETIANPGFTRVTFANGVVLNYKRLETVQGTVKVRVRFGAGRREIAKGDYYIAELGAELFVEGGLGKHDTETMRRLFSDHGWSAELSILDDAFVLQGATNAGDLETQMQILGAFLTDPGFRKGLNARMPTTVETMDRQERTSASHAITEALNRRLAPDGAYVTPAKETLLAVKSETFERLFKPALTQAPLEVTIVGDAGEDQAIAAVASTLGALPARAATPRAKADTWFLRYPAQPPAPIRTTYEGKDTKAVVSVIWPLYVAEPKRRREEYALSILSSALDDAIRHRVREEMGKSYAPEVSMSSPDFADQGALSAYIETTPADADTVAKAARETAAGVADKGLSQEAFEAARKPSIDAGATRLEDIDEWLTGLDGSAANPEVLREFVDWEADFGSVRLEDVNRYAKQWLTQEPIVVIAVPTSAVAQATDGKGAP